MPLIYAAPFLWIHDYCEAAGELTIEEAPPAISLTVEDTPEVTPDTTSEITDEDAPPGAAGDDVPPTLPLQDASNERQIIVIAMGRIYFFKTEPSRIYLHCGQLCFTLFFEKSSKIYLGG